MDQSLMDDIEPPLRKWEVLLTVPLDEDRGALVPPVPVPPNVMGAWSAAQAVFSVPVRARRMLEAGTLGLAALGDLADQPGASATVRPA